MRHEFEESKSFDTDMPFSEIIRKKRRLLGMNQADFGEYIGGYHQHTISTWETGIKSPSFDEARRIIEFLGGEVRYIDHCNVENPKRRERYSLDRAVAW